MDGWYLDGTHFFIEFLVSRLQPKGTGHTRKHHRGWMARRQDTYFHRVLVPLASIPPIAEDSKNVPIAKIRIHPTGWPDKTGEVISWVLVGSAARSIWSLRFHRWIYRQEQSIWGVGFFFSRTLHRWICRQARRNPPFCWVGFTFSFFQLETEQSPLNFSIINLVFFWGGLFSLR